MYKNNTVFVHRSPLSVYVHNQDLQKCAQSTQNNKNTEYLSFMKEIKKVYPQGSLNKTNKVFKPEGSAIMSLVSY